MSLWAAVLRGAFLAGLILYVHGVADDAVGLTFTGLIVMVSTFGPAIETTSRSR